MKYCANADHVVEFECSVSSSNDMEYKCSSCLLIESALIYMYICTRERERESTKATSCRKVVKF